MFYFKQYKGIKYLKKIKSHLELNVGIKDQVLAKAECFDSRNSSFHLGNEHELRTFYCIYFTEPSFTKTGLWNRPLDFFPERFITT